MLKERGHSKPISKSRIPAHSYSKQSNVTTEDKFSQSMTNPFVLKKELARARDAIKQRKKELNQSAGKSISKRLDSCSTERPYHESSSSKKHPVL